MKDSKKKPQRIAVTWAPSLLEAKIEALKIVDTLKEAGGKSISAEGFSLHDSVFRENLVSDPYDLVITLGGDGTMLRTGNWCTGRGTGLRDKYGQFRVSDGSSAEPMDRDGTAFVGGLLED